MAEERCERTDLLKSQCSHCTADRRYFIAQYPGECSTCKGEIKPGEGVRDRGDGTYEHARH